MSKQGVKLVIAALLSDPRFKKDFFANPRRTLRESGFALTHAEMKALLNIKKSDVKIIIGEISRSVLPIVVVLPRKLIKLPTIR